MKWVHFIGICGAAMAPIAVMMRDDLGWFVTGSDKGFFPPFDEFLKKTRIEIDPGIKVDHLKKQFYENKWTNKLDIGHHPDLVVVGNFFSGEKNVELQEARRLGLEITHYPGILEKFVVRKKSIVVAGTAGKTTVTGALIKIFRDAGKDPSFMVGGMVSGLSKGVESTPSEVSIIEGDEPWAAKFEKKSKFFFYHPEYLILTNASWEHVDMFPTESDYIENFKKLALQVPSSGKIIANLQNKNLKKILSGVKAKVITYGNSKTDDYQYEKGLNSVTISHKEGRIQIRLALLGDHNKDNMVAAFVLALEFGIEKGSIQKSIESYMGVKRRLEIKYVGKRVTVIDDFGSSPPKAKASIEALRERYPKDKNFLRIIYEPNVGNRTESSFQLYSHLFDNVDEVIIPRLSMAKGTSNLSFIGGGQLREMISQTHKKVAYFESDEMLINYVLENQHENEVIAFMGSHGFRNMIPDVIERLKNEN